MQLPLLKCQNNSTKTPGARASGLLILGLAWTMIQACDQDNEWRIRVAVKALATAPELEVPQCMDKVVAYGRLALVDIEQVIQGAEEAGRARLLEALRKIGDPEAIPLCQIIARWDPSKTIRQEAQTTIKSLKHPIKSLEPKSE